MSRLQVKDTYRVHVTSTEAMRDLLNAHPDIDAVEVGGWTEVKIEGVLWRAPVGGAA